MAESEQRGSGWRERRREAKRANAERTGDTPEKQRERRKPGEPLSLEERAKQAGVSGVSTPL